MYHVRHSIEIERVFKGKKGLKPYISAKNLSNNQTRMRLDSKLSPNLK